MAIRDLFQPHSKKLTEALDRLSPSPGRPLTEATTSQPTTEDWYWGRLGTTGSDEDYFWRRLSDNWTQKDVIPATYVEIHNQCYEAYNANPMANAIIEMGTNFVLGDGMQIDARHPKVQKLIDAFWSDPDNRMNLRQYDLVTELALYGELFIRVFVNPYDGHVKLAQIDPILIDQIDTDPENIEHEIRVHRRDLGNVRIYGQAGVTPPTPGMNVGGGGEAGAADGTDGDQYQYISGRWFSVPDEVLHFAINKVSNAKRGKSDLATLLPWLRRYRDWLIDRVRINKYKAAFLWDVTLMGANLQTIEQKSMEYARPPEPGSVLIHNESEIWNAVQPKIDAGDVAEDGHAMKLMIAMGAGLPEHYMSDGGDVNRATAAEMGLPTTKKYQRRQDYCGFMVKRLLDRVILEAQKAGTLPKTIDTTYQVRFPQLITDDIRETGAAAYYMAQALQMGKSMGIVSQETAMRILFDAAREEIDLNEETKRIKRDQELAYQQALALHAAATAAAAAGHPPANAAGRVPSGRTGSQSQTPQTPPPPMPPPPMATPGSTPGAVGAFGGSPAPPLPGSLGNEDRKGM